MPLFVKIFFGVLIAFAVYVVGDAMYRSIKKSREAKAARVDLMKTDNAERRKAQAERLQNAERNPDSMENTAPDAGYNRPPGVTMGGGGR